MLRKYYKAKVYGINENYKTNNEINNITISNYANIIVTKSVFGYYREILTGKKYKVLDKDNLTTTFLLDNHIYSANKEDIEKYLTELRYNNNYYFELNTIDINCYINLHKIDEKEQTLTLKK